MDAAAALRGCDYAGPAHPPGENGPRDPQVTFQPWNIPGHPRRLPTSPEASQGIPSLNWDAPHAPRPWRLPAQYFEHRLLARSARGFGIQGTSQPLAQRRLDVSTALQRRGGGGCCILFVTILLLVVAHACRCSRYRGGLELRKLCDDGGALLRARAALFVRWCVRAFAFGPVRSFVRG